MGHVPAQPRRRDLGPQLPPGHRPLFRPLYALVVVTLGSRRVVHVGVTRHPTDARAARQLREATPFGERPRDLIRNNDRKSGPTSARVAEASGIAILGTPYRASRANALCARFLGSVRRECRDSILVLGERHPRRVPREYVAHFNRARQHRGLDQAPPEPPSRLRTTPAGPIRAVLALGGLHHTHQRAA